MCSRRPSIPADIPDKSGRLTHPRWAGWHSMRSLGLTSLRCGRGNARAARPCIGCEDDGLDSDSRRDVCQRRSAGEPGERPVRASTVGRADPRPAPGGRACGRRPIRGTLRARLPRPCRPRVRRARVGEHRLPDRLHHQDDDRRSRSCSSGKRGDIDLDAPASDYLRAYRLILRDPRFRQPTIRHLLTHTAGIPDARHLTDLLHFDSGPWDGRPPIFSVPFGDALPSLGDLLPGWPGSRRRSGLGLRVQQSHLRDAGPDRRGRQRAAPGPIPPRARLRATGHAGHRPHPYSVVSQPVSPPDTPWETRGRWLVPDLD